MLCGCYHEIDSKVNMGVVVMVIRLVCCVLWQSGLGCLSYGSGLSYVCDIHQYRAAVWALGNCAYVVFL